MSGFAPDLLYIQLRKIIDGVDGNTDYQQVTRFSIDGSFYFLFTENELFTVKPLRIPWEF